MPAYTVTGRLHINGDPVAFTVDWEAHSGEGATITASKRSAMVVLEVEASRGRLVPVTPTGPNVPASLDDEPARYATICSVLDGATVTGRVPSTITRAARVPKGSVS